MRKKITALALCILITLTACNSKTDSDKNISEDTTAPVSEVAETKPENIIKNSSFSSDSISPWDMFKQGGVGTANIEDEQMHVTITNAGTLNYAVQVFEDVPGVYQNCKYQISFDARSTIEREIEVRLQINGGDYHPYAEDHPTITTEMKNYSFDFEMTEESDPAPRFVLNLGKPSGMKEALEKHEIYFDNIKLFITDDSKRVEIKPNENLRDININQIGYLPDSEKIAVFRGDMSDKNFEVIDKETDKVVLSGTAQNEFENKTSDEINYFGDFSEIKTEGTYYIKTANAQSYDFKIAKDVYDDAYDASLKMLYLQRCGQELPKEFAGDFAHAECHTAMATIYGTDTQIDVSGGWHDAGDYGKYVVAGAKTVADMLLAYNSKPESFSDNTNIPESKNGIPDILDEVKYELGWMLKMQDIESGGVYHKVTTATFPSVIKPEDDTEKLFVYPISQAATGDFAAVMAMSYNTYKDIDSAFADTCLAASKKAWDYIKDITRFESFTNPKDCVTGEYGDESIRDEKSFAAAALYAATGEDEYLTNAVKSYATDCHGLGWADVSTYANYLMVTSDLEEKDKDSYDFIMKFMIKRADELVELSANDGYFSTLKANYYWGSNMGIANDAMFLIMMNEITPNEKYIETSRNLMNYLFGTNPMSICYLTGYGTISPEHPHHRMSQFLQKACPGMLIGGPDCFFEDPYTKSVLIGTAPAKCYVDSDQSYSTNEITIYWNSPLLFDLINID